MSESKESATPQSFEQAVISQLSHIVNALVRLTDVDRTEEEMEEDAANAMTTIMQRSPREIVETFGLLVTRFAVYQCRQNQATR